MCSYENISDVSEHWEEDLWANVLSPASNISMSCQYQIPDASVIQTISGKSDIVAASHQDCQVHVSTAYQNGESPTLVFPTWDGSDFEISQNGQSMSTYFSTFNPSSDALQLQEIPIHQNPVIKKTTSLKTLKTTGYKKLHCARISLVPSENGTFKAIVKRKRKRIVFTTEQLEVLEAVFSKKPYVTRDERAVLVESLQVNDKSIKVWFQNRRLKNKKGEAEDDEVMQRDKSEILDRLDTVESEINKRTDAFGYVTLDDKIMADIVNVIDDYFSNEVSRTATRTEADSSPIYEPISPASVSDHSCEDKHTSSQLYDEPNDYIQKFMDIESLMSI